MSVAVIAPTVDAYPNGVDQTERRTHVYGKFTIPASPAFYTTGGLPFSLSSSGIAAPVVGLSYPVPLRVDVNSQKQNGYLYEWTIADLWPQNTAVVVGQAITDSNGNLQQIATGGNGTTNNTAEPTWNTTVGGTTTDGSATWTNMGPSLGTVKILTGAAAQSPLAELSQSASIPAAVSGDTIRFRAEFRKG